MKDGAFRLTLKQHLHVSWPAHTRNLVVVVAVHKGRSNRVVVSSCCRDAAASDGQGRYSPKPRV